MTTRHSEPIACECGNKGAVVWRENDAPFSRQYEEYSLSGFDGSSFSVNGFVTLDEALSRLRPKCPACGATGKVRYTDADG